MNSNTFWKLVFVALVIAWSFGEITPPTNRDLIQHFDSRAKEETKDEAFNSIVAKAKELQAKQPHREYGNLFDAVGDTKLAKYFPDIDVSGEKAPNGRILKRIQKEAAGQIQLGIDLQGGTYFVVQLDDEHINQKVAQLQTELAAATNDTQRANLETEIESVKDTERILGQAVEVLRKRVDTLGVAEPILQPLGSDRIVIQLPGLAESDLARARTLIERAAFLEFRLVHPESDELSQDEIIPPGYELKTMSRRGDNNTTILDKVVVGRQAEGGLTGQYVRNAFVSRDPISNKPYIILNFNSEGGKKFGDLTSANVNKRLAIVLDGELYSAPNINEPILGGSCQITGDFTIDEAIELSNILENPLEAPVKVKEERTTDPSLGADSIKAGITATKIGLVSVVAFMLVYYLSCGVVANVALALNLLFLLGVMCSINATLTLPGIAGILLTIGMAVDANVLIFERIREEFRGGKGLRAAIGSGYDKAFSTIFDANSTTLIASVILIFLGTGPVKGFGVTLTIGIAVSMFTSLIVTRMIFDILVAKGMITKLPMLQFGFLRNTNFDFIKFAKPAFIISWILVVVGVGFGISRGGDAVGVDLKGGDQITYSFTQEVGVDELRSTIDGLNIGASQIQYQTGGGSKTLSVLVAVGEGDNATQALQAAYPQAELKRIANDSVGPSIGAEILKSAVIALLLALFCILMYVAFRYEFSFAVAAVVAIFHDILMTMGWYFLTGRELNAPTIAAVLTIVGFSINDTIVIFDRIREDLAMGLRGSFRDIINRAVNQTLARTVITSGTTLLSAGALFLFGGSVINDFAFTFVVGVITGTYSSIYIAAAIVLRWHKGDKPKTSPHAYNESAVVVPGA